MPTQLKGRRIVNGSWYCFYVSRAKYSLASFWNPYVENGGGLVCATDSGVGNIVVFSYIIEFDSTTMCLSWLCVCVVMVVLNVDVRIRLFAAMRSYARAWKYAIPPIIAAAASTWSQSAASLVRSVAFLVFFFTKR